METIRGAYKKYTGRYAGPLFFLILIISAHLLLGPEFGQASVTVTASGPGGTQSQTLPDSGGAFDISLPLTKNAVNTITVTATDSYGYTASQELKVTQLSLNQIVVSQVTAQRMTKEEIKQAVNDGVINLDNPANYNVSKFDIVLTIANKPVPISVAIPVPVDQPVTGYEVYKMPSGDSGGGKPQDQPPQIVVFDQPIAPTAELPDPPRIPGVIIIEGNIKSLKEFYTVRLLLMNTSGIFTLKNVISSISFPTGGLSSIAPVDGIISFGDILPGDGGTPGQAERQFIIRGDEIGVRPVKVDFGGTVAGPGISEDKPIPFNGSASTQVEVKGPPTFRVQAIHPDSVEKNVPYELKVNITNTGDIDALYTSLALDVGADAQLVECDNSSGTQVCTPITGSDIRNFGDIAPTQTVSATFTINPLSTGAISSCVGISDQNITLQVLVGNIGCLVGQVVPDRGVPDGVPTLTVLPTANMQGVSTDSPVTAFFSQMMNQTSITTGNGGTFNVFDSANNIVPGVIRFATVNDKTVAIWQMMDNITNRLAPNTEYTVFITKGTVNTSGTALYSTWTSKFTTTGTDLNDRTPPTLTLSVEPPVNPSYVLPGQKVLIDAYAADQGSGVVRVELRIKDLTANDTSYQLVDRKVVFKGDKPPFIFTIDSGNLVPGHIYQLLGTAYDYAMNSQDATTSLIIASSAAAPTITLPTDPTDGIPQGISVSLTPQAVTGGVTEVRYYLDGAPTPFSTVTLAPYQMGLSTLTFPLGVHTIRALAVDGLGQTGEAIYTFKVVTNPNKPQIALIGTTSGASYIVGVSFVVSGTATDQVGIKSLTFYLDSTSNTPIATGSQPFTISTSGMVPNSSHQIIALAVNNLDVSNTITSTFVAFLPNGSAPGAPSISVSVPSNGQVTVTGMANPGARVDVTNTGLGITVSVYATGSGAYSVNLPGSAGQVISAVQYDFSQSQSPSTAATGTVQTPPVLKSISVTPATSQASPVTFTTVNAFQDITVTGNYSDNSTANITGQATFSSSDPSVASVSSAGRIVALQYGTATITVKVAGMTDTYVYVKANIVTLNSITASPFPVTLTYVGQTQQLTVTGQYSDGSAQPITGGVSFFSNNTNVATVASGGIVTAKGGGSTQITISYPGVSSVQVTVNVNIQETKPTVTILSPAAGTKVERQQTVTVQVEAKSNSGGVTQVALNASGQTSYSETKQVSPASLDTTQSFSFQVSPTAAIGGTVTINVQATDTSARVSDTVSLTLNVADLTAPSVTITAPANQARHNYGDTVNLAITANDDVGVTQISYRVTGAFTASGSQNFTGTNAANASFSFVIPSGLQSPNAQIVASAQDAAGNVRSSVPVNIYITSADIIAPSTHVTSVGVNGALATITYQVDSGLSDLDHVELYFRRNGIGTYNRYFGANGDEAGKYLPQSGNIGYISFDSTMMGGDGTYEFYSLGVDFSGNREFPPYDNSSVVDQQPSGLIAYYPFNGNSTDESGHGHDGIINQAVPTTDRLGQPNRAFAFDGVSSYIDAGTSDDFNFSGGTGDFTIGALINPASLPTYAAGIVGKATCGATPYSGPFSGWAFYTYSDGRLCIGNVGVDERCSPSGTIVAGQWAHVTVSKNGTNYKIYKNGVLVWSGGYANIQTSDTALRIGTVYPSFFRLKGTMDEVAIYGRALSDAEVQKLSALAQLPIVADQTATFSAGTVWKTITSPATVGEGDTTYDGQNLRVSGTTLTVNGHHNFGNVDLLNGAVLTHSKTSTTVSYGININVWTITIDGTSSINVDVRGFLGGLSNGNPSSYGRTVGNVAGSVYYAAGSYGGIGATPRGTAANPVYGSPTNPLDLGSGGGSGDCSRGGDGGGLVLIQAVNVINDSLISANGEGVSCGVPGSGSGGTINITAASLSGLGTIRADGGSGEASGGGGRIALRNADLSTVNSNQFHALGGSAGSLGGNGTVFLGKAGSSGGDLVINGEAGISHPESPLLIPSGYLFDNIILQNGARVVADSPINVTGSIQVLNNSILTHSAANEGGVSITAKQVVVDATSNIDVSGRGYSGGGPAKTLGGLNGATYYVAGSYGGYGASASIGAVYGHPANPIYLGSGGGTGDCSLGGAGGGRVTIQATNEVRIDGQILANGTGVSCGRPGSGSGGSVKIQTSLFRGTGTISAAGGSGERSGGGGRIAIFYDNAGTDNFNGFLNITALGGSGSGWVSGSPGTVLIRQTGAPYGDLYLDAGNNSALCGSFIPLTIVGFGVVSGLTSDTLATDGTVPMIPNGLVGLEINPNLNQTQTYTVISNTATTITVDITNKPALTSVAGSGNSYAGIYRFDNLYMQRCGSMVAGDQIFVPGTWNIGSGSTLTHYDATTNSTSMIDITVGTLNIQQGGAINVDYKGYLGGGSSGNGYGITVGNVNGSYVYAGGSYGGFGAAPRGTTANTLYGSLTDPIFLGSGGGQGDCSRGGDGGGLVLIDATTVNVDGLVSANGEGVSCGVPGSGSGGTVNIHTNIMSGLGMITVNGGNGEAGGGGGRIALHYGTLNFDQSRLRAWGGSGGGTGGNGSIFLKQTSQTFGDLIIDNGNGAPAQGGDKSIIPSGYVFDNIIIQNGAGVVSDSPVTVPGSIQVLNNSILTHSAANESGVSLMAKQVVVDATSKIDVSGRGYSGGGGSGKTLGGLNGANVYTGGSYGGYGGSAPLGAVYGQPANPIYLGSGGGQGDCNHGGSGGGRVTIQATNEVRIDGQILSNGTGLGCGAPGSGSGGSVKIQTSLFRGTGTISAAGGSGERSGGGGRIAIFYDTVGPDDFNGFLNITALGGSGSGWVSGSPGTVLIRQTGAPYGDLYLDAGNNSALCGSFIPLTIVGFGVVSGLTSDTLATDGTVPMIPNGLVGLEINPNLNQTQTYTVISNTATTITVDITNKPALTSVAGSGNSYAGIYRFDNLYMQRCGSMVAGDQIFVPGTWNIGSGSTLTHYDATTNSTSMIDITVGTLNIQQGGAINVDYKGYLGGGSSGNNSSRGRTVGNGSGSTSYAGGSYGGLGASPRGGIPNSIYGDYKNPLELGSGGGNGDCSRGGDGGGTVLIESNNILVNGTISANGEGVSCGTPGSGSGGAVNITTTTMSGAGTINTNGGSGEVGGGGGRIAIIHSGTFSFIGSVNSSGGTGSGGGYSGTVYIDTHR